MLSRLATSRSLKEAFEPPYRGNPLESFSFGPGGVSALLRESTVQFSIDADIELGQAAVDAVGREIREFRAAAAESADAKSAPKTYVRERYVRYSVTVEISPQSGTLRVVNESLAAMRADGQLKTSRRPFLERVKGRLHLRMERQAHPMQFEAGLDHTILSRPLYAPHYPHLVATKYELGSWLFFYFEPRERMRVASPVREVRHIGSMGEELAGFLNTLKLSKPRQFEAIEKALQVIVPQATGVRTEVNQFGEVELQLIEAQTAVPARLLSEGTLRILGLLAVGSSPTPPSLIALEEPENGVHPRRIELIAEYLRTQARRGASQLIVTTHSPTLLDQLPAASLYVVTRDHGSTTVLPYTSWGPLANASSIRDNLDGKEISGRVSDLVLSGELDA